MPVDPFVHLHVASGYSLRHGASSPAALVARGVSPSSAELTAHAAIAVFRVTFGRWVADTPERPFADIVAGCARSLTHVAAGGRPTPEAL